MRYFIWIARVRKDHGKRVFWAKIRTSQKGPKHPPMKEFNLLFESKSGIPLR